MTINLPAPQRHLSRSPFPAQSERPVEQLDVGDRVTHTQHGLGRVIMRQPSVYAEDFREFAPEWSGDADSYEAATPLKVKPAKTTAHDAEVAPGGSFTGSLVTSTGERYAGSIDGDVFDAQGRMVGGFYWDGSSFHTTALPGGELKLAAYDPETGTWRWWYDGATSAEEATPLHFERGETKEITFHLP